MPEPKLFDEIARALARPVSRRKTFLSVCGAIAVFFGTSRPARASLGCGEGKAPKGATQCDNKHYCNAGSRCCVGKGEYCECCVAAERCNGGVCED